MIVEVLNTGTELLLGNVVNTHLSWLGKALFPLGLRIARQTTIPDGGVIRRGLIEAFDRCDILIVTGGLGPTTDDITREVAAELLGLPLREDPAVTEAIEKRLRRRGIELRERMKRQTMVPEGAVVLPNDHGTAPGLYLRAQSGVSIGRPHLFFLPGPPRELKPMFENYVVPLLKELKGAGENEESRIYHVVGLGESTVEEVIGLELTKRGDLEVGYCARPNEVDLRLIGPKALLDAVEPRVVEVLGKNIVSRGESIEFVVVNRLRELRQTMATAESCTGGLLAHRLTNVPGASEIFNEGFVTYSNEAKVRNIGVPRDLLGAHGAVSDHVARAMAEGVLKKADADFGVGITGIAGPGGGTEDKPVGTVFVALAQRGSTTDCARHLFPTDRETFKDLVTQVALDMLRRKIT